MTALNRRASAGLLLSLTALAALIFLSAWTFDYWQAWLFMAVMTGSTFAITLYLMNNDPKLLERRMNAWPTAEQEKTQKIIRSFAMVAFITAAVVPALDHRFTWSQVPAFMVVVGNLFVLLGFYIIFLMFQENTFASCTIKIHEDQKVISTGPYSLVRHPMYAGGLLIFLGVPIALGSYWGLFTFIPVTGTMIWRVVEEEKFLAKNLPGYTEYLSQVPYRLVPFIW